MWGGHFLLKPMSHFITTAIIWIEKNNLNRRTMQSSIVDYLHKEIFFLRRQKWRFQKHRLQFTKSCSYDFDRWQWSIRPEYILRLLSQNTTFLHLNIKAFEHSNFTDQQKNENNHNPASLPDKRALVWCGSDTFCNSPSVSVCALYSSIFSCILTVVCHKWPFASLLFKLVLENFL